jgi:hypothetical protein
MNQLSIARPVIRGSFTWSRPRVKLGLDYLEGKPTERKENLDSERTEDRIRTRAYFRWLARADRSSHTELDDWLAAEAEEHVLTILAAAAEVPIPEPSFTQDNIWYDSEKIARLFQLMKANVRKRRAKSHLLSLIDSYQDYLTSSSVLSDKEAFLQGTHALQIVRLVSSLRVLVGPDFARTASHTVSKELKDLFSDDSTAFETAEFNLFSAAAIQRQSGLPVLFVNEGDETSPDLRVDDLAYVECKDIHTQNRENIEKAMADNLAKAHEQLAAAQRRSRLPGTGVCIDVPWGTLDLRLTEWDIIRRALSAVDGPQFVLVSSSGVDRRPDTVGFPVAVSLVWHDSGRPLFEPLLRHLTRVSHKLQADRYDQIIH